MLTPVCQRWRDKRSAYRPAGETIATAHYEVAVIKKLVAKAFVEQHHYSGKYPAQRLNFGLFRGAELVGVAVLSQPSSEAALDVALPFEGADRAELGRFVLLDDVPANGESWFLSRAFELARAHGFEFIVSHSDPMPRTVGGRVVFPGHIGTIYQATNAVYVGITPRRTRRMCADGKVLDGRMLTKLRTRSKGVDYALEAIVELGAAPPPSGWEGWPRDRWLGWCKVARDAVSTPVRHTGSHRYLFGLDRRLRARLPDGQRYPKAAAVVWPWTP